MTGIRLGRWSARPPAVSSALEPGERLLSWAEVGPAGHIVASDRRLLLPGVDGSPGPVDWDRVLWARWNPPTLTIAGRAGRAIQGGSGPDFELCLDLDSPGNVPAHVRERIEATIVVQRRVMLGGGAGARLVARRKPQGPDVNWFVVFDPGVDSMDPELRRAADLALAELRGSVGI